MDKKESTAVSHTLPGRCVQLCTKYTLFVLNFFITVGGICLMIVGVVAVKQVPQLIALDELAVDPAVFLLWVGGVMVVMGFLGCMGPLRENLILLKLFSASVIIVFLMLILGGILSFVYLSKVKSNMKVFLVRSISHYQDDNHLQDAIDYIQKRFGCCGATDYMDWEHNAYFNCSSPAQTSCGVPISCCKIPGNMKCGFHTRGHGEMYAAHTINTGGCIPHLMRTFKNHMLIVGGIALAAGILELFGLLLAGYLMKNIRILLKQQETNNNTAAAAAMTVLNTSSDDTTHITMDNSGRGDIGEESSCLNGIETKRFYTGDSPVETNHYYIGPPDDRGPDLIKQHFYHRDSRLPSYTRTHTDFYPP